METAHVLNILEQIRTMLIKKNISFASRIKNCNLTLDPTVKIVEICDALAKNTADYHGYSKVFASNFILLQPGIKVADYKTVRVTEIGVKIKGLALPALIHTFIHELAHSVTVPEQVKEHCLTRLDKKLQPSVAKATKAKKYIANHHPETFYKNLAKMLRTADELGIYILPKNFRDFTSAGIKRYDTYVNPNDKMSLGTTNFAFE